ncbi:MAG: hypothetical protein NTV56_00990 [Alphaproteobacteria bacterium]|nr:hypothetical protein [Alphaproteobacteria bacterium]
MVNCTKRLTELTPSEVWHCLWAADDWKIIGGNIRRTWDGVTGTTIGEWLTLMTIPAMLASYILPLAFVYVVIQTMVRDRGRNAAGPRERRLRTFWGFYLVVAGTAMFAMSTPQSFETWQGMWMVAVGAVIMMLRTSHWCGLHDPEAP